MLSKIKVLDQKRSLGVVVVGIILAVVGGLGTSFIDGGEVFSRTMSLMFGLGFGLIGGGLGALYKIKHLAKIPGKAKQLQIEYSDERNELIRDKASAKAGEITNWAVLGLAYVGIVVDLPIWIVFTLIGIFVVKYIVWIVLMNKYNADE